MSLRGREESDKATTLGKEDTDEAAAAQFAGLQLGLQPRAPELVGWL